MIERDRVQNLSARFDCLSARAHSVRIGYLFGVNILACAFVFTAAHAEPPRAVKNARNTCSHLHAILKKDVSDKLVVWNGRTDRGHDIAYSIDLDMDGKSDDIQISNGSQEYLVSGRMGDGQAFERSGNGGIKLVRVQKHFYFVEGIQSSGEVSLIALYEYSKGSLKQKCDFSGVEK